MLKKLKKIFNSILKQKNIIPILAGIVLICLICKVGHNAGFVEGFVEGAKDGESCTEKHPWKELQQQYNDAKKKCSANKPGRTAGRSTHVKWETNKRDCLAELSEDEYKEARDAWEACEAAAAKAAKEEKAARMRAAAAGKAHRERLAAATKKRNEAKAMAAAKKQNKANVVKGKANEKGGGAWQSELRDKYKDAAKFVWYKNLEKKYPSDV